MLQMLTFLVKDTFLPFPNVDKELRNTDWSPRYFHSEQYVRVHAMWFIQLFRNSSLSVHFTLRLKKQRFEEKVNNDLSMFQHSEATE